MSAERERFSASELAVVISHYDLGVIESAKEYARGSRHSPKLLLQTASGRYLLKRRAAGRDKPERVDFSHRLLHHLYQRRFPVPSLVPRRDSGASALLHDGRVYELFEYVAGHRYDGSLEQTQAAGRMLARFHRNVAEFESDWRPPGGGFHDSPSVRHGLNTIPTTASSHDSVVGREAELLGLTQELYERYDDAAARANELGWATWPECIAHGDWHPGNMLFSDAHVSVVLDFDSARVGPMVADVANGMLQFSILRSADQPDTWPEFFDLTRMRRFFAGYQSRQTLSRDERRAIPHLMIESLIAESAFPIAATGSLGAMPGFGVLQMVRRKIHWLIGQLQRIEPWLLD